MFKPLLRAAASFLLLSAIPLAAQSPAPITAADMLRHIQVLASDAYQGRAPATEGERLATSYVVEQLRARGLEPAGLPNRSTPRGRAIRSESCSK